MARGYADNVDASHWHRHVPVMDTPLSCLLFHTIMYGFAHRLEIQGLKTLAKDHFQCSLVETMPRNLLPISISMVYNPGCNFHEELQKIVVKATIDHMAKLRSTEGNRRMILDNELLDDIPEFAHDLLVAMMERNVRMSEPEATFSWDGCC